MQLWRAYSGSGMAPGYLPFAGGYAEQPAALMAALEHMRGVEADLRKTDEDVKG